MPDEPREIRETPLSRAEEPTPKPEPTSEPKRIVEQVQEIVGEKGIATVAKQIGKRVVGGPISAVLGVLEAKNAEAPETPPRSGPEVKGKPKLGPAKSSE